MVAGPAYWSSSVNPDNLRSSEKELVSIASSREGINFLAIYDLSYRSRIQAQFSILTTLLVCSILYTASTCLTNTNDHLLIHPIEIMIKKIKRISQNPVRAAHQEEDEQLAADELKASHHRHRHGHGHHKEHGGHGSGHNKKGHDSAKAVASIMETIHLDMTLTRVGGLLALGFGEAGSEIIAKNISDGSEIDAIAPG